jgi:hypothetical protein
MATAMQDAYGREPTPQGDGGSIPLCNVFQQTFADAEIMLLGVEEPLCRIQAPNESVDPTDREHGSRRGPLPTRISDDGRREVGRRRRPGVSAQAL